MPPNPRAQAVASVGAYTRPYMVNRMRWWRRQAFVPAGATMGAEQGIRLLRWPWQRSVYGREFAPTAGTAVAPRGLTLILVGREFWPALGIAIAANSFGRDGDAVGPTSAFLFDVSAVYVAMPDSPQAGFRKTN